MYDLEEWINKPHTSVEEILEELTEDTFFNLMISEAIREDALDNTLSRFQQRLQQFNVNSVNNTANTSSPDDFQFGGDESAIDTSLQNTQLNMQNNPQGNMQQPQQNMIQNLIDTMCAVFEDRGIVVDLFFKIRKTCYRLKYGKLQPALCIERCFVVFKSFEIPACCAH